MRLLLLLMISLMTALILKANIVEIKPIAPIFLEINDNTFTNLDLNDYFVDDGGLVLSFYVEKKSPGVDMTHTATGNVSLTPHANFLGKSTFEVVIFGATAQIYKFDVYVKVSEDMINDCDIQVVNIGVYNFDPFMPQYNAVCHEAYNWNDPIELTEDYFDAIVETSNNYVYLNLVHWVDIDDWGIKTDGFKYNPSTYDACRMSGVNCHSPDIINYPQVISEYGVDTLVQNYHAEEIWFWGGPEFGYWEASMAGTNAYRLNVGLYPSVPTDMPFPVMGFNYERGLAEMLHSNGHRLELHMEHAYNGQWNLTNPVTNWDLFTANTTQSTGVTAGIGNIHFPPNADSDYDYGNPNFVQSRIFDYGTNYPMGNGALATVNRDTWGGPDYHLGYMKWWFEHLPKNDGINPDDGRLNNWWKYIYDFRNYNMLGASTNYPTVLVGSIPDFTLQAADVGLTYLYDLSSYIQDTPMSYPNFYSPSNIILKGTKVYFFNDGTPGQNHIDIMICDNGEGANFINFTVDVVRDIRVNPKFMLGGAYDGLDMNHQLLDLNLLPLSDPYGLGESVTVIPPETVDWVIVEIRDVNTPNLIIVRRACFVNKDGDIIDTNGGLGVKFTDTWITEGYVAVRHRNHLGVMSGDPIVFP